MKFYRFFLYVFCLSVVISCSSDNEPETPMQQEDPPEPELRRIKRIQSTQPNGDFVYVEFTYNSDGTIATRKSNATGPVITGQFFYQDGKITSIEKSDGNEISFSYAGNRISRLTEDGDIHVNFDYTYDPQGRVETANQVLDDGTTICIHQRSYNGNSWNIASNFRSCQNSNTYFTYDAKNNPGFDQLPEALRITGLSTPNNYTSMMVVTPDWERNYTRTYTYNADDYPMQASELLDGELVVTHTYTYY